MTREDSQYGYPLLFFTEVKLMGELTVDVKKVHKVIVDGPRQLRLVELSWNGRDVKGIDIRKYSVEDDRYMKGVTIPYDAIDDLISAFIEIGYGNRDSIMEAIKEYDSGEVTDDAIDAMFDNLRDIVDNDEKFERGFRVKDSCFSIPKLAV